MIELFESLYVLAYYEERFLIILEGRYFYAANM